MGSDDWSGFNIWILQAVKKTLCPLGRSLILCCVGLHINILHFITLFNTYMEQFLPLCFFFMIFELRFWHKIYE